MRQVWGIGCREFWGMGKESYIWGMGRRVQGIGSRVLGIFSHTLNPIPYTLIIAFALLSSCTSDLELPPPPEEHSSSSQEQNPFCVIGEQCLSNIAQDKCLAAGGLSAETCPAPSSSSQSGGISSSSVVVSSSSSIPEGSVLCLVGGNCIDLTESQCSILGGQSVSACPVSSSSVVLSSSSLASSSSVIAGDDPQSSSSVVVSSSSSFPASGTFIDGRDGQEYSYVTIGSQVWMSENLNYNASGSRCYGDNTSYCDTYGRLYDWSTAMAISTSYNSSNYSGSDVSHRGVCPIGWHLPSDSEWDALATAVGGASTAGRKLKAVSGWNYYSDEVSGTDDYGFSALPGGYRSNDGSFDDVGSRGRWWSATEDNASYAYYRILYYYYAVLDWNNYYKEDGLSVRCLRD